MLSRKIDVPPALLVSMEVLGAGEWRHHNLKAGVIEHVSHITEEKEGEGERAGEGRGEGVGGGEDDYMLVPK